MSLMARFGCRDRDLVVEAMAAWAPWARRMMPGGQVAQGGHDLGAVAGAQLVAVFIKDDIADPVELVLDSPVPAYPGRDGLGLGVGHGQGAHQVDHLHRPARSLSGPGLAVLGGAGASDPDHLGGGGESPPTWVPRGL